MTVTELQRFASKFTIGPSCWEWKACKSPDGYGRFGFRGVNANAHRLSFTIFHGIDIPDGMCVCHSCDNRGRVNPSHLWLGTKADNVNDMINKARHGIVPRHLQHKVLNPPKLSPELAKTIRDEYIRGGVSQRPLAKKHGVHQSMVSMIVSGRCWSC